MDPDHDDIRAHTLFEYHSFTMTLYLAAALQSAAAETLLLLLKERLLAASTRLWPRSLECQPASPAQASSSAWYLQYSTVQ